MLRLSPSIGEDRRSSPLSRSSPLWTLVIGLFILSGAANSSAAQEFLSDRDATSLLELPPNQRGDVTAVSDLAFSPDGKILAIGATDGAVRILPACGGSAAQLISQVDRQVQTVAFSPEGRLLASAAFWNVKFSDLVAEDMPLVTEEIASVQGSECIAFSADGRFLAIGHFRDDAALIDRRTDEKLFDLAPFAGTGPVDTGLYKPSTFSASFSPDGDLLAVTTVFTDDELPAFQNIQVWDTKTGKLRFFFRGVSCGFSPCGELLAYRSQMSEADDRIVLLDINTFLPAGVLTGQYQAARFTPTGHFIAAISRRNVELWAIPSRKNRMQECKRSTVLQHPNKVTSLAFAPDGRSLVTGDDVGVIRLWNLAR